MAYVYRHIRADKNEPFYIGIGSDGEYKRAYDKQRRSPHWKYTAAKGYEVEILMDGLTWEQACEKEKEFIKLYGRKNLRTGTLINRTDGGDGVNGYIHSCEARKRISDANKGNTHNVGRRLSEEHKAKILKSLIGNTRRRGKPQSNEARLKMSIARKGRKFSEEHCKKIGDARRGKTFKMSEDTKEKISKANSGKMLNEKNPMFKGVVIAYKDGAEVGRYMGGNDAARKLNIGNSGVKKCLAGRFEKHKGYTFKRLSA